MTCHKTSTRYWEPLKENLRSRFSILVVDRAEICIHFEPLGIIQSDSMGVSASWRCQGRTVASMFGSRTSWHCHFQPGTLTAYLPMPPCSIFQVLHCHACFLNCVTHSNLGALSSVQTPAAMSRGGKAHDTDVTLNSIIGSSFSARQGTNFHTTSTAQMGYRVSSNRGWPWCFAGCPRPAGAAARRMVLEPCGFCPKQAFQSYSHLDTLAKFGDHDTTMKAGS